MFNTKTNTQLILYVVCDIVLIIPMENVFVDSDDAY